MASARKIIIIGATSGIGYEITQLYRKQDGGSGLPDGGRNCSQKSGQKHLTRSKRHK